MKQQTTVWLAGVLCMTGWAAAEPGLEERLTELGRQVVVEEVKMVAVQDAVRQAAPADAAAVQAQLARQEVKLTAILQQAKESLAQAAAMHAYAQKQMRLAKESLGRSLVLADEAKAAQLAAERAVRDAAAREEAARRETESVRQESEALASGLRAQEEEKPQGPAVIYGGFHPPLGPPTPPDPWAASRNKGPYRVVRSGTASDLGSPMQGIPIKR